MLNSTEKRFIQMIKEVNPSVNVETNEVTYKDTVTNRNKKCTCICIKTPKGNIEGEIRSYRIKFEKGRTIDTGKYNYAFITYADNEYKLNSKSEIKRMFNWELGIDLDTVSKKEEVKNTKKSIQLNLDDKAVAKIAKSLVAVSILNLDMCDSLSELVYEACGSAGININELNDKKLNKRLEEAYISLIKQNKVSEYINNLLEIDNLECLVDRTTGGNELKHLIEVAKFASTLKDVENAEKALEYLKDISALGIKIGTFLGYSYYQYLDSKIFGTISNDVYTVGHAEKTKDYDYIFRKDFNCLELNRVYEFACTVKSIGKSAEIKIYSCKRIKDTYKDYTLLDSFKIEKTDNESLKEYAKIIASVLNKNGVTYKEYNHKLFLEFYKQSLNEFFTKIKDIDDKIQIKTKDIEIKYDDKDLDYKVKETQVIIITPWGIIEGQTYRPLYYFKTKTGNNYCVSSYVNAKSIKNMFIRELNKDIIME